MASTIKLKNSTTAGNAPSSLETGEVAINVADGNLFYGSASAVLQNFVVDELEVKGNLTAQQYIVSSSVTYMTQSFSSGSTIFGDTTDDTHQFTGSVDITGSLILDGITYPTIDGTDGQSLLTDGAGNLTFEDPNQVFHAIKNKTGATLTKGTPVFASGSSGNTLNVYTADASDSTTMPAAFIVREDIADDAEGKGIIAGFINGIDTSTFDGGDTIYVAVGGGFTNIKPTGSALLQNIGKAAKIDASNGSIIVMGAGRTNDVPNLDAGKIFYGQNNTSEQVLLTDVLPAGTVSGSAQIADVTLTTAAQTNITSVGTLDSLAIDGDTDTNGNNITLGGGEINGASTIDAQTFKGATDQDLLISSDGNITFKIDDDNDETGQSFKFQNDNNEIAKLDESGNLLLEGHISASNGLFIDGPSNSHVEVGEYAVGIDFNSLFGEVTGSGLIISGAMADNNHHNFLKIGNVELVDLNNAISTNEFLIHNVATFKMTSGSDGGDVAHNTNEIFVHNGTEFFLCKGGEQTSAATIRSTGTTTTIEDADILLNASNGVSFSAPNVTSGVTHFQGFTADPNSTPQQGKSIAKGNMFTVIGDGGAVTASMISSSGTDDNNFGGRIIQDNNKFLAGTETGGTTRNILGINGSDVTQVANANIATNIKGTSITLDGPTTMNVRKLAKTSNTDADHQGDVVFFGSTTSMDAGKIYYYNSSGNWALTDADAESSADGLLAVALGASSDTDGMLIKGMVTLDHDPGTVGDPLFLSTTAGQASSTAPSGTNDIVRLIGYCLDSTNGQIYFNPSNNFIEHS